MARILILGGGFAAVSAAETLADAIGNEDEIILVSKNSDFTLFPAIVPMIFGDFATDEIQFDLRPKLLERGIRFIQGEVHAINLASRTVEVSGDGIDSKIRFDYLLLAVGRRLSGEFIPGLFEHSHNIMSIEAALKFKEAISAFKNGSIVVGLAPGALLPVPVCESALALAERFSSGIRNGNVSVSVIVPTSVADAFAGGALFRDIEGQFDRMGIRLVSDFAVTKVDETQIHSANGHTLRHDLLMLIPPFGGHLSTRSGFPMTNLSGFVKVNTMMQVEDVDRVYAAGEIVAMPGPKFGYMAIRQGKVAAANILAELSGEKPAAEYIHKIAWAIGEKYAHPVFFHYGFWDETLDDFDENALLGMAKTVRERYGPVTIPESGEYFTAAQV